MAASNSGINPPSPCPSTVSSKDSSAASTLTNVTGLHPITGQLLNSAEWLQFVSRVNRFKFIDDDGKSSSAGSSLPAPTMRIVTLDHATTIAEARRIVNEEANALRQMSDTMIGMSFAKACELILKTTGRVIVSGLSKGGHVERKLATTLASTGTPAFFLHPDDLSYHGELDSINEGDLFIAMSKTGNIAELMPAILRCERLGVPVLAITAKRRSHLSEVAQIILEIPDVPEACTITSIPTTSAHCISAFGDALAICTQRARRGLASCDYLVQHTTWRQRPVKEIMSTDPLKLPATVLNTCPLTEAIPKLLYSHAGLVGIINEQGQLIDALTDGDIRLIAKLNTAEITVEEALLQANSSGRTSALTLGHCVLLADEQVMDAVVKMSAQGLRGAFVINEAGDTVGYLSLADCLEAGVVPTSTVITKV